MSATLKTIACCLTALIVHIAAPVVIAQSVAEETRTLVFPDDRSMGLLYLGPAADVPYSELNIFGDQLRKLGPAKGKVEVPRNAFVRLDISIDAGTDLSPLGSLPADAIHFLYFRSPITGQLKHISGLLSLRVLYLRSCPVKDADLKHIANLKNLESIMCSVYGFEKEGYGITDESMKLFGQLPKLKQLMLRSNPVTDKGVDYLESCRELETLSLNGSKVSGEGLNSLMMLENLTSLSFGAYRDGSPIDFKGMKTFGNLAQLEHLNLSGSKISDEELLQIRSLTNLKSLTLDNSDVTDVGLEALEGMTKLERLRFYRSDGGGLGDEAARALAKLPNLKKVTAHWNLSPDGIRQLARMKSLESIDLSDTVTDAEVYLIGQMKGLKRLTLQNCPVTDVGVKSLVSLDQLESLSLYRTQASAKSISTAAKLNLTSFSLVTVNEVFETWPSKEWEELAKMENLERLSIEGFLLDESHWKVIGQLTNLKSLEVGSRFPSGFAAKAISSLKNLGSLELRQCRLTAEDAKHFEALDNLGGLNLDGQVDEAFLLGIAKLPALGVVQVSTSEKISPESLEVIKKQSSSLRMLRVNEQRNRALSKNKDGIIVQGTPAELDALDGLTGKSPPQLIGVDGAFDLSQFKSRPVVVHFWRARGYNDEVPPSEHIADVIAKFPKANIQVVGVHRSAGADRMPGYMLDYDVTWPCFVDKENKSAKLWKNPGNGRDHLYLIGADGKLKASRVYIGDLENALKQLLKKQD